MYAGPSQKLKPFGESIFSEMTRLAVEHKAINLSQGFPDFDGPDWLKAAAIDAVRHGPNQYAPMTGQPALRQAIARKAERWYGMRYDPDTEISVFSGATEAIFSSINGLLEPGDEVILIEPYYDSYPACVAMAGGHCRYVALRGPSFDLDLAELVATITPRTRLLMLNTPNNPCGKVFSRPELEALARVVTAHDLLVITDEVYEHIVFDGQPHVPLATLPGMRERVLTISSTAKTFSMTGWKIGYVLGPASMVAAARSAHQFVTFCTVSPFQMAMAQAIDRIDDYAPELVREYDRRRQVLMAALQDTGLGVRSPQGAYFVLADIRPLGYDDDRAFCHQLATEVGVAAIPASAFYRHTDIGRHLVRFAFCKNEATLSAAGEKLLKLREKMQPCV
ncbi:MAG TPA: methionine aminotransferase [Candidatus Xenobia bacterium]|jgi:N-succinyldiaminopimelate aminotransferase